MNGKKNRKKFLIEKNSKRMSDVVKQYEGWWATKPVRVKEGLLFSYYAPSAKDIFLESITRSLNSITYLPNMRMVKNFLWLYVLITILNLRSSIYMLGKTDTLQLSLMSP